MGVLNPGMLGGLVVIDVGNIGSYPFIGKHDLDSILPLNPKFL